MKHFVFKIALSATVLLTLPILVNAQRAKDPCESVKIQLTTPDAPDFTLAEIKKNSQCINGGFIRVIGIYRVAFENSDLYDPVDQTASAWLSLDPFYAAVKRCGSPMNLKMLDRKNGGTFGFVGLGIIKTGNRFGHMGGWENKFEVMCLEKVELLSENGFVFSSQPSKVQKKIVDWYKSEVRKLY